MKLVSLGRGEPDTILSGVKALIQLGMYPVALLVFFASITVPMLKLIGLVYEIASVWRQSERRRRDGSWQSRAGAEVRTADRSRGAGRPARAARDHA